MTVPEVAKFLRGTADKVLRWIHGGELAVRNAAVKASVSHGRRKRVWHQVEL